MDAGLIFSYIIAGFLIILIGVVSLNNSNSSSELTLQETQKRKITDVIEVITYDIPKIGYNLNVLPDTLLRTVSASHIEFYSNIDNSANGSLELVRWEFSSDAEANTQNPNDFILYRTVNGVVTSISAGITSFSINYYDELGSNTPLSMPITAAGNKSAIDDIIQLEITMNSESAVPIKYGSSSDSYRYLQSSWTKRFSPVNLRNN
tara:strand:- start:2270 stop:2887 length:618 start_codon:yes stop_codon:yes gene_type:complete